MKRLNVLFDERWIGPHGIGRVATELQVRLDPSSLRMKGSPVSPVEPFRFWLNVFNRKDAIVFSPGYNAPIFPIRNFIFIIHDLNHIECVDNSSFLKRLYYSIIIKRACRYSLRILTVSEFSKERIVAWSGVSPDKVVNIGNGVGEIFCPDVESAEFGYPYFLAVSNRKAHKNELRTLEAFCVADVDVEVRMVFTGTPSKDLLDLARARGVEDRLVFLGRVNEADLPGLYRGALALLFPSLYEGFGLPVIEAMACGTPVLTSTTTALPEVAGDAALLVNPESVREISDGIRRLYEDEGLRAALREKGLERCKLFQWDAVAARVHRVLEEA